MATAFIGLGSNLGDRQGTLTRALERLRHLPQTKLLTTSSWIETQPMGGPPQGKYLNGAAQLDTDLEPGILLELLQKIEADLGRSREDLRWGPRVIDLDLLSYDDLLLETPDLILPHPRIQERPFVLLPLAQIAPDWKHPHLQKTAAQLLRVLTDAPSSASL